MQVSLSYYNTRNVCLLFVRPPSPSLANMDPMGKKLSKKVGGIMTNPITIGAK